MLSPTVMIVAGESSADLHGANLARSLIRIRPGVRIIGAGGEKMKNAGVEILHDSTKHATVGIIEAFANFHKYLKMYRSLVSALRTYKPHVVVLMDLPDFNLKFGRFVKSCNIPVAYYIGPQIWAWRSGRIKQIAKITTKMLVIFDFEEKIYKKAKVDVSFVGHPLLDVIKGNLDKKLRKEFAIKDNEYLIGLLPASRREQFNVLFPIIMNAAKIIKSEIPQTRFVIACAPNIDPRWVLRVKDRYNFDYDVVYDRTYDVMASSDLLIMASGTATIEATLIGTPMIVTYKINPMVAFMLKPFVKVKNYAMVNILAGCEEMPEFYQSKAKPELIAREAISMIREERLLQLRQQLLRIREKLGSPGASDKVAIEIMKVARPVSNG